MAQEREKSRIVLASILKPVDDTRMTEKMGQTLAGSGLWDVTVIGFGCVHVSMPGLTGLPLGQFKRIGFSRWKARWRIFRSASKLRPHVFIFSTHELILQAILLKIIFQTKIIYDVRENYYRNIRHSEGLAAIVRWPLALWVRLVEKVTAPAIDHFFLAEKGYEKEFRFFRGGWTVIENKAAANISRRAAMSAGPITLLFTGTLSESSGIFRAIRFAEQLFRVDSTIRLRIVGYAASRKVQHRIREQAASKPFIELVGIESLVPHTEIVSAFSSAHAAILAYPPLPHTINSVPTKLFEYLQAGLPILTEAHWPWVARFSSCQPFHLCNIDNPDVPAVLDALKRGNFYNSPPPDTSWASEAPKLLAALARS